MINESILFIPNDLSLKKAQLRIKFKGSPTAILLDISLLLQQVLIKKIFCIFLCLFFYFPTATDVHKG